MSDWGSRDGGGLWLLELDYVDESWISVDFSRLLISFELTRGSGLKFIFLL